MSWGLHKEGFKILAGVDNWKPAINTFKQNHIDAASFLTDITKLDPTQLADKLDLQPAQLDCLIGGPPCQGFSKNVPASYRFLDDPRNLLFRDYLGFVAYLQPKVVIMENVAEIFNAYNGSIRKEITDTLEQMGYAVRAKIVTAAEYGVPQTRKRCLFFASRTGVVPEFPIPTHSSDSQSDLFGSTLKYLSAWDAISDLPTLENGEGYEPMPYGMTPQNAFQELMRQDIHILFDHVTRELNQVQFARVSSLKAGQGIKDLPDALRPKSGYSGAYGRLDFENPSPTITRWVFHPGSGRYCHPLSDRLITMREAARLQSFSDDFRFTGSYIEKAHQIGNAVPPLLMSKLAPNIKSCLGVGASN